MRDSCQEADSRKMERPPGGALMHAQGWHEAVESMWAKKPLAGNDLLSAHAVLILRFPFCVSASGDDSFFSFGGTT